MHHVAKQCFLLLFADDSNLFYTGNNIDELAQRINEELSSIIYWLEVNKLSLNIGKTHYILFRTPKSVLEDIDIQVKNVAIDRVTHTKFLGVQIDEKLCWKPHTEYIGKNYQKV